MTIIKMGIGLNKIYIIKKFGKQYHVHLLRLFFAINLGVRTVSKMFYENSIIKYD